jgi:hypothetical protein
LAQNAPTNGSFARDSSLPHVGQVFIGMKESDPRYKTLSGVLPIMEDDEAAINSELRYIVIELMKLAAQNQSSFDEEMDAFIDNAYKLRTVLIGESFPATKPKNFFPASKSRR